MRGDGVGVGDVGEVPDIVGEVMGYTTGGDDGGGAGRERDAGMVIGRGRNEFSPAAEPSGDGIELTDGAWGRDGVGGIHGWDAAWAHGMRGDGVGVGDGGEVSGGTGEVRDTAGSDDGRTANREHNGDVVNKRTQHQRDTRLQPQCPGRIHFDD